MCRRIVGPKIGGVWLNGQSTQFEASQFMPFAKNYQEKESEIEWAGTTHESVKKPVKTV
jgi:hypothetical protein